MFIFFLCDSVACDGCSAMCEVNSNEQKHLRWDIKISDIQMSSSDTETLVTLNSVMQVHMRISWNS